MILMEKKSAPPNVTQAAWLDLLRESLWCKTYLRATLGLCLQYLHDCPVPPQIGEAGRQRLLEFLTLCAEKYVRESPAAADLEILFNLDPAKNPEHHAAGRASLEAWLAGAQHRLAVLTDLSLRAFGPAAAADRTAAALEQAPTLTDAPNSVALRRLFKNIGFLEILLGETFLTAPPRWLILDQNNVCNFQCKMCLTHAEGQKTVPAYFPFSANLQPTMALADKVTLGGSGEPLLYPGLEKLLQAQGLECHITINTNASLVKKKLNALGPMTEIDISFDGDNPTTFEALRCGGHFENTLEAVRLLREKYPHKRIILNVVVSRLNADEVEGIAKIADQLGLQEISVAPIYVVEPKLDFLRLRASDQALLAEQYRRIAGECEGRVTVINNIPPEIFLAEDAPEPRHKPELLRRLQAIPPASPPQLWDWQTLLAEIQTWENFTWWPVREPLPPAEAPRTAGFALTPIFLRTREQELGNRLGKLERIRLPFCLAPWLISYVTAHALVKPCCFYTYSLDESLQAKPLAEIWNSPEYRYLREAMLGQRPLPVFCRTCQATMRFWAKDHLLLFAANYGFKYLAADDALEFGMRTDLDLLLPH